MQANESFRHGGFGHPTAFPKASPPEFGGGDKVPQLGDFTEQDVLEQARLGDVSAVHGPGTLNRRGRARSRARQGVEDRGHIGPDCRGRDVSAPEFP